MAATSRPIPPRAAPGSKRPRTWDVDVSLDELVSWDVLEQFMQDIPSEPALPDEPSTEAQAVQSAADGLGVGGFPFGGVMGLGGGGASSAGLAGWPSGPGLAVGAWGGDMAAEATGGAESPAAAGSSSAEGGRQVHKQRFVWTAELHRRFETAVNTLGIDHAKPQAISQMMKCEGEGAPTRQNIKSHLQKYRLLMQKRGKAGASAGTLMATLTPSASCASLADQDEPSTSADTGLVAAAAAAASAAVPGKAAAAPRPAVERDGSDEASVFSRASSGKLPSLGPSTSFGGDGESVGSPRAPTELDVHLARQEMNLKVQMDLQTKLHRQLLMQRQLQHQLETFSRGGMQRWQAMLSLKNSLRERLTKHVAMQQEMLQHLDAIVSSEVSRQVPASEADGEEAARDSALARAADGGCGREASAEDADLSSRAGTTPTEELLAMPLLRDPSVGTSGAGGACELSLEGGGDAAAAAAAAAAADATGGGGVPSARAAFGAAGSSLAGSASAAAAAAAAVAAASCGAGAE